MAYELDVFADTGLDAALLEMLIAEHEGDTEPRLRGLWSYYRNELTGAGGDRGAGRWYRQGQASGLPARLKRSAETGGGGVVIENDIAWRVDSLVDFVFGRPVKIVSGASDAGMRGRIERTLDAVFERSGGARLFQDMALLGSVYGHVDLVVRLEGLFGAGGGGDVPRRVRVELIEPTRGIAVLDPGDFRGIEAYVIRSRVMTNEIAGGAGSGILARVLGRRGGGSGRRIAEVVEVISARHRQVYVDGVLVEDAPLRFGALPIVHAQNTGQPFRYEGISDVEAMVPLQDELNARLSDRAHRVTMQSFKMYLAKGIEGFGEVAVGPGQVWTTDNPDASVEGFGGDADSPSEDRHIAEVREALDKVSGVSPLVLGVVRAKVGHLSSENALRIALMGVLSKTMRKRQAYGGAIVDAGRMILDALDASGVMETREEDRALSIRWPDPIPVDERDRLREAQLKRDLGVPAEVVLAELGYGAGDGGVA